MKPAKDYSTTRFMFGLLSGIICLGPIIYVLANEYEKCMYGDKQEITYTPSQDTQQILQAISGSQLSMEMLVTEKGLTDAKCYFDDNTGYGWTNIPCPSKEELPLQEPVINDCPVYCNSVSCRCDEEAYKERDKMSNDDPNKFMYIEEQGIKNYFDRTKVK